MKRAILVRHAESVLGAAGIANGDPRVPNPLSPEGEEQARALAVLLDGTPVDLCVTSEFERARETAEIALTGRDVLRLVLPELNDVRFGRFEGGTLADYREWAGANEPTTAAPGGGESRAATITRYVHAYRTVLARSESTILVVAHGLPIRYVLNALENRPPEPLVDPVPYAEPYRFSTRELKAAVSLLEKWGRRPTWLL